MRVTDTVAVPGLIRSVAASADGGLDRCRPCALTALAAAATRRSASPPSGGESTVTVKRRRRVGREPKGRTRCCRSEIPSQQRRDDPRRGRAVAHRDRRRRRLGLQLRPPHPHQDRSRRRVASCGKTPRVGQNPLALAAIDHTLWTTIVADNSITRLSSTEAQSSRRETTPVRRASSASCARFWFCGSASVPNGSNRSRIVPLTESTAIKSSSAISRW